jgi:hypothetical protein
MRATITVLVLCALGARAGAGTPRELVQGDSLSSGIETRSMLDAELPGFRVTFIRWDSGFRNGGLAIGDRIIGVNGKPIVRPRELRELQRLSQSAIGTYGETQAWAAAGLKDGAPLALTVLRRLPKEGEQTLEVRGVLRADRRFLDGEGKITLGPGGPQSLGRDGFAEAWSSFCDRLVRRTSRVLDGGWQSSMSSRSLLAEHLDDQPRVEYLVAHYPGPFADAVKADWERVRESLQSNRYVLTDKDLEYRSAAERRVERVTAAARAAFDAFLQAKAASRIEPFPAVDPIRGDRKKVAGKIVLLPSIANRDWVMNAGRCFMTSGGRYQGGWYFVDCLAPATQRLQAAVERYRRMVSPQIAPTYVVIGRVTEEAKLLVVGGAAATGLMLDVQGALVGERMFVDLTGPDPVARFAGEAELMSAAPAVLDDKATPAQVMEAFISAAKQGHEEAWYALFARFYASRSGAWSTFLADYYPTPPEREWVATRRLLLDRVYDVRVAYVSPVRRLLSGKEFRNAPVVDEVGIEVDHVGKFDGEYRSFTSVGVHRLWTLQRVNGGPWRIAQRQGL